MDVYKQILKIGISKKKADQVMELINSLPITIGEGITYTNVSIVNGHVIVQRNDWITHNVKCDLCGNEWIAMYPLGLPKLQCPECSKLTGFKVIEKHC
jgi:hypothetical protein